MPINFPLMDAENNRAIKQELGPEDLIPNSARAELNKEGLWLIAIYLELIATQAIATLDGVLDFSYTDDPSGSFLGEQDHMTLELKAARHHIEGDLDQSLFIARTDSRIAREVEMPYRSSAFATWSALAAGASMVARAHGVAPHGNTMDGRLTCVEKGLICWWGDAGLWRRRGGGR